jgi:serine/threonine-protein phosphatase 5
MHASKFLSSYFQTLLKKVSGNRKLSSGEIMDVLDSVAPIVGSVPSPQNSLFKNLDLAKLTICGDIHGQFDDMKRIMAINGQPSPENPYLFNGDFVDRGPNSLGCILTLFLYKLISPNSVFLNRGNHELPEMNAFYGFRKEVGNDSIWIKFNQIFHLLPIAHIVNRKIFVVHGGLPRKPIKVDQITDDPDNLEIINEFLWNDPIDTRGIHDSPRGANVYRFGPDITERFLKLNNLRTLVRSHEMVDDGFEWSQNGKCLTVFSAPYYAGHYKNFGAFAIVDANGNIACKKFESVHSSRL